MKIDYPFVLSEPNEMTVLSAESLERLEGPTPLMLQRQAVDKHARLC